MSRLSKKHFWEWFSRHNHEYIGLEKKSKKEIAYWLDELCAHLRAYFKFFEFSIMGNTGKQEATLTITVNGKVAHFKKVDSFVAKAPKIPGWTITALEDPKPIDFALEQEINKTGIDPRELYFCFDDEEPEYAGLIIYHPLCTPENKGRIFSLAWGAVYNLLGERSFGMDIHGVEVANLSHADPDDIKALEELPDALGMRRSGVAVDENGNLLMM